MNTTQTGNGFAVASSAWLDGKSAPKDGTLIVAVGRVIYGDDISTSVAPFCTAIRWTKEEGQYEGWHTRENMSIAQMLADEVIIDYWLPYPSNDQAHRQPPDETAGA